MISRVASSGLALFARFLLGATFLLVVAGGLVTSTDSGLSVPDWPTTYGQNMFTFPLSKWVGGIRFEHSHRLIAATVGLLTIGLVVWTLLAGESRLRRVLAVAALALVVVQGVLGGLTVRYLLPTPISVAHACLAQTFFCLLAAIVFFLPRRQRSGEPGSTRVTWGIAAVAAVYVQLILGAWMRHSQAALAIPDFPASFGRVVPDHWDWKIASAFAHRAWALVAAAAVATVAIRVRREPLGRARGGAALLLALIPAQLALGAFSIWTGRAVPVTVAHVAVGALTLATTVWVTLGLAEDASVAARARTTSPARASAGGAR